MAVSKVTLAGMPLRVNPSEVRWNFKMKTTDEKALGGKVIQVFGLKISDLTVRGRYAPDRSKGDTEAWQQQMRFRDWIESLSEAVEAAKGGDARPIRFTYPPRGWDFRVFVMEIAPVNMSNQNIAEEWEMKLFPFDTGARKVVEGVKDLYIKRLMDGMGWKQTEYNGPTQQEVDDLLAPFGGSVIDYIEAGYEAAAYGTSGSVQTGSVTPGVQQ